LIAPGQSVIVLEEASAGKSAWRTNWGVGADGSLLDSYLYVANTRGVSFESSAAGIDLGLSVVGENGAVRAVNLDIGSPGFSVVPVPAAAWLFGSAVLARRSH